MITMRRLIILAFTTALATLFALCALTLTSAQPLHSQTEPKNLQIAVPQSVTAGEVIEVEITNASANKTVRLYVNSGLIHIVLSDKADSSGNLFMQLDNNITRAAGVLQLLARSESQTATAIASIKPGPAIGLVEPVVGPRSIVANGVDHSMAVVIARDNYGNAIEDGSAIDIFQNQASGRSVVHHSIVANQLAWALLTSDTKSGTGQVRANGVSNNIGGRSYPLLEVAGPPIAMTLSTDETIRHADGKTLTKIQTSSLKDRFGNPLPNGTAVNFTWQNSGSISPTSSVSSSQAVVIDGVAQTFIQAPSQPETLIINATCKGVSTKADLLINFDKAAASYPVNAFRDGQQLEIKIGPVTNSTGAYLPDGTKVNASIYENGREHSQASGQITLGKSTISFSFASPSELKNITSAVITILGTRIEVGIQ